MAFPPSYHYIIVGGGTSGLVVADRLSETPNVQVLVLGAGKDLSADPLVNIPAFFMSLIGSDADWKFRTVPQAGLNGRSIREAQGKALGGSSAINSQTFAAPGQAEINAWAKLGKTGLAWPLVIRSHTHSYPHRTKPRSSISVSIGSMTNIGLPQALSRCLSRASYRTLCARHVSMLSEAWTNLLMQAIQARGITSCRMKAREGGREYVAIE